MKRVAFGPDVGAIERLQKRHYRGWKKLKWIPHRTTVALLHRARRMIEEVDPENKTADRVVDFIETFLVINHYESLEDGSEALFKQMTEDGLCAKTTADYLKMGEKAFGGVGPRFRRVIKVLGLLGSDDDPKHAVDRSSAECLELIKRMKKKSPRAAIMCELIMKTPLRCKDATRMRPKGRLILTKKEVKMRVRLTKNIRNQSESVVVRIPYWFGKFSPELETALKEEKARPFQYDDVREVIRGIRQVDETVTTYTFRRCFMHRALSECKFDFKKCIEKFSLHKQVKTLRAYYDSLDLDE
jgi:hypothetical protein